MVRPTNRPGQHDLVRIKKKNGQQEKTKRRKEKRKKPSFQHWPQPLESAMSSSTVRYGRLTLPLADQSRKRAKQPYRTNRRRKKQVSLASDESYRTLLACRFLRFTDPILRRALPTIAMAAAQLILSFSRSLVLSFFRSTTTHHTHFWWSYNLSLSFLFFMLFVVVCCRGWTKRVEKTKKILIS